MLLALVRFSRSFLAQFSDSALFRVFIFSEIARAEIDAKRGVSLGLRRVIADSAGASRRALFRGVAEPATPKSDLLMTRRS